MTAGWFTSNTDEWRALIKKGGSLRERHPFFDLIWED